MSKIPFGTLGVVLSALTAIMAMWLLWDAMRPPFSLEISNQNKYVACPGEIVSWDVAAHIRTAPVTIYVNRSWVDLENKTTLMPQGAARYNFVYPTDNFVSINARVPDLPPGRYAVAVIGQGLNTKARGYMIEVDIPEECE